MSYKQAYDLAPKFGEKIAVMRYSIVIPASLALLVPGIANAKRARAAEVEPVIDAGVRYIAPNDEGRRGYIQARDANTGKLLWELTVYHNFINPFLEEDVQWVFIKKLSLVSGKLIVVDERGHTYRVDLKTRAVITLQQIPPGHLCSLRNGARGPMGLEELTSYKWLGIGTGQVRT